MYSFILAFLFLFSACLGYPQQAFCLEEKIPQTQGDSSNTTIKEPDVPVDKEEVLENSAPIDKTAPDDTIDALSSRANDWKEPSRHSEQRYVLAIRKWLASMQPFQREVASKILKDAHPGLHSLRMAIREKKAQLATLNFNQNTDPETLPRLGKELQELRALLRIRLEKVAKRLRIEAGVKMGPLGGDGFWLAPPDSQEKKLTRQKPLSQFDYNLS